MVLMSNESAYPLQTESDPENRRGNGLGVEVTTIYRSD